MIVRDIIRDIITHTLEEIKEPENMTRVQIEILDPIITYAFGQLYPFIIATSLLFFLTFIIAVTILIFVLKKLH